MPYIIVIAIWLCIVLPVIRTRRWHLLLDEPKGSEKDMLPVVLLEEFIGKVCAIEIYNELTGISAKIVDMEENWLKVQTKKETKLINGNLIKNITILSDKYQW